MRILAKDFSTEDLFRHLAPHGLGWREARAIQKLALLKPGASLPTVPPSEIRRKNWDFVLEHLDIPHLETVSSQVSAYDGFKKYLFRGEHGDAFEAVRIPLLHRAGDEKYIVCVSSQVGCNAGCSFCATGKMGLKRNLKTWEIVDQVIKIQEDSPHPVRGVVFMGMGEPLLNYGNVIGAAKAMTEPCGLSIRGKAITISTVGIVPGMRRLTDAGVPYRLILSLHSAIPEKRAEIVPMTELYSMEKMFAAVRYFTEKKRKKVPLAWTLMSGVNTGLDEAKALAHWTKDLPVIIDMIPVNDASGRYRPPEKEELDQFVGYLRQYVRKPLAMRYSGGKDIHGACGMLANQSVEMPTTV